MNHENRYQGGRVTCDLCGLIEDDLRRIVQQGGDREALLCGTCLRRRSRAHATNNQSQFFPHLERLAEAFDEPLWEDDEGRYLLPRAVVRSLREDGEPASPHPYLDELERDVGA